MREQIGVELYSVQQELAKLQNQSEVLLQRHSESEKERADSEKKRKDLRAKLARAKGLLAEENQRLLKHQSELDSVNAMLRQAKKYDHDMKGEVSVARRATYHAEQQITEMEKRKRYQDLYIQNLNDQIKGLRDQVGLYESQIEAQKEETKDAKQAMSEAFVEMEAVAFEKRQLLQQWKSSLIGVRRRDEALQATRDALEKSEQRYVAVVSEIEGVHKSVDAEDAECVRLREVQQKIVKETKLLEKEAAKHADEFARLEERYEILRKSLEQTDEQMKRVVIEKKNLVDQCKVFDQNFEVVERERQGLEEKIASCKNAQTTVSKAAQNLNKVAGKVQEKIHGVENEISKVENEISRIKVDRLRANAHNEQLQRDVDVLEGELKEKDSMIVKYSQEIRRRNDEAEKKMYTVDRLNRRYEQLTLDKNVDENHGPLEATIHNLKSSIEKKRADNVGEQRSWLKMQQRLVDVTAEVEDLNTIVHEDVARITVYQQQRLRLDNEIVSESKVVSDLKKSIEGMHGEMKRLNRLIAENMNIETRLKSDTSNMEKEFKSELRELEMESIRLDRRHDQLKSEHDQIVNDVMEMERQVLLWEKKIQLERETQKALDPEVGMAEARSMENEIHRMTLRYNALKREQESMLKDMELAIQKREAIAMRNRGKKKSAMLSRVDVKSRARDLSRQRKKKIKQTQECSDKLNTGRAKLKSCQSRLEERTKKRQTMETKAQEKKQEVNELLYMKQKVLESNLILKRMREQYRKMEGRADADVIEDNVRESRREEIMELIDNLKSEFPQLKDVLARVGALSNQALPI